MRTRNLIQTFISNLKYKCNSKLEGKKRNEMQEAMLVLLSPQSPEQVMVRVPGIWIFLSLPTPLWDPKDSP